MNFKRKLCVASYIVSIFVSGVIAEAGYSATLGKLAENEILMSSEMSGFYLVGGHEQLVLFGAADNQVTASAYKRINDYDTYYFQRQSNYSLLRTRPAALLAKNMGDARVVLNASFYSYFRRNHYTYDKIYTDTSDAPIENISNTRSVIADFRPEIEIFARYRQFFIGIKQMPLLNYKKLSGYFAGDTDALDKSLAQEYNSGVSLNGKTLALVYAASSTYKKWSIKYFQAIEGGYLFANSYLMKSSQDTGYKIYASAKYLKFFNIYKSAILGLRLSGSGYETGDNLTVELLPGLKKDNFYFYFIIGGNHRFASDEARVNVSMPGFTAGYGNFVVKWDGAGTLFYKVKF